MILGLALAIGLLFTRIMKLVHLPNVTGYLIAGVLIGPCCFKLFSVQSLGTVEAITEVALGFIAFSIGASIKLSTIKQLGKSIITITCFQALTAVALVDLVLWIIGTPIPLAITLGAIATATAPAATLMVVRQYRAKGKVTDTLLPVVALDDAIGLIVFAISLSIAKVLAVGGTVTVLDAVVMPLLEILISFAVGGALGFICAYGTRLFKSRANRLTLIIAITMCGVALATICKASSLLICMTIGCIYCNFFKQNAVQLDVLDRWTYPLFMLFFIISGAQLDISVLPTVGIIGIMYLIARSVGKYLGALVGAKIVKADDNVCKYLGLTLLPQAGVAIGMATIVMVQLPQFGEQVNAIVLAATLVYELIGPLVTKIALIKAGEIDRPTPRKRAKELQNNEDEQTLTTPTQGDDKQNMNTMDCSVELTNTNPATFTQNSESNNGDTDANTKK